MSVAIESPPAPGMTRLQIGDWTVEPALNQLSAAGKTIKLEPKAMAVLAYLADRPGQVVSRDALLAAVWPGVVVGDDSLTQVIIKLRKALGDVPGKPSYIQTISKGGYRLVAPVLRAEEIACVPAPTDSKFLTVERNRRVHWMAAAGIGALLLAVAGIGWFKGERAIDVPMAEVATQATEAALAA
jgi:transcriptional activator of cad operon